MNDQIERQIAIDAVQGIKRLATLPDNDAVVRMSAVEHVLFNLPSAQPEIVRCKDCKYSDENWQRVSVRWLPCMDMRTGSNWFCGSAERRTDAQTS